MPCRSRFRDFFRHAQRLGELTPGFLVGATESYRLPISIDRGSRLAGAHQQIAVMIMKIGIFSAQDERGAGSGDCLRPSSERAERMAQRADSAGALRFYLACAAEGLFRCFAVPCCRAHVAEMFPITGFIGRTPCCLFCCICRVRFSPLSIERRREQPMPSGITIVLEQRRPERPLSFGEFSVAKILFAFLLQRLAFSHRIYNQFRSSCEYCLKILNFWLLK